MRPRNIARTAALPVLLAAAAVAVLRAAPADDLIGGIGLTHLTVYDQRPAPDARMSGSPHVHAVTDEGYYVLSGKGAVELHDAANGYRTVDLTPGRYVQFPPGTLHRLVNGEKLVLLVVMGNAGLAERGDARIYFGRAVDDDPAEFARLTGLAKEQGLRGALDRRDAAVKAYMALVELWTADREAYFAELARFVAVHREAASASVAAFSGAVEAGPVAWGEKLRARVGALPHVVDGAAAAAPILHVPDGTPTLGMCGVLRPVTNLSPVGPAPASGPVRR
ncbi:MAG: cupin domain-containing protein [Acidobacteria bacterium]|nr:cupin domain-containing protein [Acidobacteriota bacterium]